MKATLFFSPLLLLLSANIHAQKVDHKLENKIKEAVIGYHGDIGVYVKNLRTGKVVTINADTIFPTASIVKVSILTGIIDKIEKGELGYEQELEYKDSLLYEGSDVLGSFKSGEKIMLKKVMMLMMTTSDNTASLWLQSLAGGGARINSILDSIGLKATRVNSRTPGREANRGVYGWGQTTAAEIGGLVERVYRNQLFSPAGNDRFMRCMGKNYWDLNEAISQVPPYIEVFSKNGCVNAVRSEVLLVNAPNNPYVFCIFTKNNTDISWTHANEAWTMARKLSAMLWHYFEPKDKWVSPMAN
jgi:beta-lactamase class A